MKFLSVFVLTGLLWTSSIAAQSPLFEQFHTHVFTDYAEALQEGNLDDILRLLPAAQREQYRVLLEQNATYSDFLKQHYSGSMLSLVSVRESGADYEGVIEVVWGDGRQATVPVVINGDEARTRMQQ